MSAITTGVARAKAGIAGAMTTDPLPDGPDDSGADPDESVPPANPAYATPPPEGLPDADRD
ncbi:hypothetical protein GR927_12285 [Mycolicibacterium sp. 3033]|nr:hypothetical protein [Mycolicibacterium aurantiacum]